MAFVESEALVRSQGIADNWPAMDCQKLSGEFFPSGIDTFQHLLKGLKMEEKQHGSIGTKGCNNIFD